MVGRALLRRCPRCGEGRLFRRWFTMVPTCPKCAYRFEREEGFALGASVMSLVIGQIIAVAYLIVSLILTMPDPPVTRLIAIGIALVVGSGLFIHPFTKTLMGRGGSPHEPHDGFLVPEFERATRTP